LTTAGPRGISWSGCRRRAIPAANWFLYRFATGFTRDFPILGFNKNWIAVTINDTSAIGTFQRGLTLVLNTRARTGTGAGPMFHPGSQHATSASAPCATYSATSDTLYVVTHLSSGSATYALDTITARRRRLYTRPAAPRLGRAEAGFSRGANFSRNRPQFRDEQLRRHPMRH